MGLYEQLAQNFPEEQTVFGLCLLVPPQAFKPEWNEQLAREGVKVFQNSYNGRVFFFLKKADSQSQSEPQAPTKLKRFKWTSENLELVKRLRSEGLSYRAIERKLSELGFKIHHVTLSKKLKALETQAQAKTEPKPSMPKTNCEDSLFKELMEASQMLYPKFKKATSILLREASRLLEG